MYIRNIEPSIDDLLDDPITLLLMARDGLSPTAIRTVLGQARKRLQLADDPPEFRTAK